MRDPAPEPRTGDRTDAFTPAGLTAAVFAGSSGPPSDSGRNKNFFPLRGRPIVQRQIDLVRSMGFARIVLVTETSRLPELDVPKGTIVLEASRRQDENFAAVKDAGAFGPDDRCLVLFGDTPLVSQAMVKDFLARCRESPADIHHGLVPYVFAEPFMDFFPRDHVGRKPFHAAEFLARLGCLSLARPAGFDPRSVRARIAAVMRGRKQDPGSGGLAGVLIARARVLWGGVRFMGPKGAWMGVAAVVAHWFHERGFPDAARFLRGPMTLERLDEVATRMLGCPSRLLPCPFGGASLDVDNDVDLSVHEQYFDHMLALQALQERIASKLVEPSFDMSWEQLAALDAVDPLVAAELRRHPETYREQQRILRRFPVGAP